MNREMVHESHRERRRQVGTPWAHLPPHVWALFLCDSTVHELLIVAHVCRALHELIASSSVCTCATVSETPATRSNGSRSRSRAFWTHWRDVRPSPSLKDWCPMVRRGHVAHVAMALRCGADPSANSQFAIRAASEHGHVAVVNLLLRDVRVDPSAVRQYAMGLASRNGHVEVLDRLLCDARVDPGANDQWAIRWASREGHADVVKRLLRDARVNPSAWHQYAVRQASFCGHLAVVKRLLRDERVACDVEALRRCLILARERGHDDVAALLKRHHAARFPATVTK